MFDLLVIILNMKQFSDEEEGFIPSQVEIGQKLTNRTHHTRQSSMTVVSHSKVNYRFSDGFIKKEPPQAYFTPLTIKTQPIQNKSTLDRRQKSKYSFEHPYKQYCVGEEYSLQYCRHSDEPLTNEREYLKNQIPLISIEDRNSPSLKQLKSFQIDHQPLPATDDLVFDSKFECGNLHCAFRKNRTQQYHLFMSNDTNSLGYNQWFYFSVRNAKKGIKYSFNIINFKKILNFYKHGQRIAVFSYKQSLKGHCGWYRDGNSISFEQSSVRASNQKKLFTLRFDLQFQYDQDYILIAAAVPYSYSKLVHDIHELEKEYQKSEFAQVSVTSVCQSVCNNQVPEVTITGKNSQKKQRQKRVLIFMGRQHPGEVWSSYMSQGVMRSFLKNNPQIRYLLDNYIIKIFPMINVDGVIYGNFRCDVTGVDLNRRWREPSKIFHPQVLQIKRRINSFSKKWSVDACFDLHGHSKKYNVFCYSCKHNNYTCRILPYLIQSQNHIFHMPSSTFGLTKDKQSTARAAISKMLKIQNVLTIQTSSFGYRPNLQAKQFNPIDVYQMAESILHATRFFVDKKSVKYQQSQKNIRENINKYLSYDQQNQMQSGSESEPEEDEIDFKVKINTIFDKKFDNQYKSFVRQDAYAQLHCTDIIFDDDRQKDKQKDHILKNILEPTSNQVMIIERKNQESLESKYKQIKKPSYKTRNLKGLQKSKNKEKINKELEEDKKMPNVAMYRSNIGSHLEMVQISTERKSVNKNALKNILIRDKKRLSFANESRQMKDPKDYLTLNVSAGLEKDEIHKSKEFKQLKIEQDKKMDDFLSRFQRFMPNRMAQKAKNKLQSLQQDLDHDDPLLQLNEMRQNHRRLQMQKIKHSIEQSTEIVQRQGRIKMNKREPIIDFKRFKQNERIKVQLRKLGELSERYLQGQY